MYRDQILEFLKIGDGGNDNPPPGCTLTCTTGKHPDSACKTCIADSTNPPPTGGAQGRDVDGISYFYRATGKGMKLLYGARHPNGDRYNVDHNFHNYYVYGYYDLKGTRIIEMKTDGPHHSGCTSLPKCEWAEPDFDITTGNTRISSEYPHPVNHASVYSGTSLNKNFTNKNIGFGVAAFQAGQYRRYELWVDPGGLVGGRPANQWVRLLSYVNTGKLIPNPTRALPSPMEAEVRCHGGHGTAMKFGKIMEIVPPASTAYGGAWTWTDHYAFIRRNPYFT